MAEVKSLFREVLPKQEQLYKQEVNEAVSYAADPAILKTENYMKILKENNSIQHVKSLTLEKLEKMQQAAQETIRQQEMAERERQQITQK